MEQCDICTALWGSQTRLPRSKGKWMEPLVADLQGKGINILIHLSSPGTQDGKPCLIASIFHPLLPEPRSLKPCDVCVWCLPTYSITDLVLFSFFLALVMALDRFFSIISAYLEHSVYIWAP